MKKIINQPDNYIKEMLEGIYIAHKDDLTCVDGDLQVLVSKHKKEGKVGIVTGGGSGHLPLFLGYVGKGMIDGCAVGDVFQSPSVDQAIALTRDADQGAGVLYIYGNYNGDIFTFRPAADEVELEDDIETAEVLGADDVASAGPSAPGEKSTRRGVAGIFFVYKCAGAAADKMLSLEEVKRVADKANNNVRTMGVALTPCTVPRVGKPSFEIEDDEMEIGMGIHGEPGIRRGKLEPADQIVDEMLEKIVADLPYEKGDEVAVLVNGLGATPLDEQYIVTRRINQVLEEKGISVYKYYVGEYATASMETSYLIKLLKEISNIMAENKDKLIEMDGIVGDGDLGLTMSDGFKAAYDAVSDGAIADAGKLLFAAGKAMANKVPSTMGSLMATGLKQAGKDLKGKETLEDADVVQIFASYEAGVAKLGGAKVGDKTFLDGLHPAVESLQASLAAGESLADMAGKAADAAEEGFKATTTMLAVHGRAATRGEASRSLEDPGAKVASLIMQAFAKSL